MSLPLLVITRQRSGSSAFVSALSCIQNTLNIGEFLLPQVPLDGKSWYAFWRASGRSWLNESPCFSDIDGYLAWLGFPYKGPILCGMLNCLYNLREHFDSPSYPPLIVRYFITKKYPIAWLRRKDDVAAFVSAQIALRSGTWHSLNGVNQNNKEIKELNLNLIELEHYLKSVNIENKLVDSWLNEYSKKIDIFYEDMLIKNYLKPDISITITKAMESQLVGGMATTNHDKLIKTNLRDIVTNYEEALEIYNKISN